MGVRGGREGGGRVRIERDERHEAICSSSPIRNGLHPPYPPSPSLSLSLSIFSPVFFFSSFLELPPNTRMQHTHTHRAEWQESWQRPRVMSEPSKSVELLRYFALLFLFFFFRKAFCPQRMTNCTLARWGDS